MLCCRLKRSASECASEVAGLLKEEGGDSDSVRIDIEDHKSEMIEYEKSSGTCWPKDTYHRVAVGTVIIIIKLQGDHSSR